MSSSESKIITKLTERRQIEADLRRMLSAPSEVEFRRQAQQVASCGSAVIPVIAGNLDRADRPMLTAMGAVAALLDREEVVRVLRGILRQPQRTEQARMGASTLLERFLDETVNEELRPTQADATAAAVSALEGVLDQAEANPPVLVEYVQALDRQEPDVLLAVIEALRRGPTSRAVEPLRMMAQDVREEIAAEALEALGGIRLPEAAAALQTLIPIAAPAHGPRTERLLRKLQFSGVAVPALNTPSAAWRALVSPVDGLGQQSVWFIQESPWAAHARFLNILLNDRAGAVEAVGHQHVSLLLLPPRRPQGSIHDIALQGDSSAVLMLEAHFDLGRRLVIEALAHNRETQIPVAGALRWLGHWLWGHDASDLPAQALPHLAAQDADLVSISDRLIAHPALITWTARSEHTQQAAEEALQRPGWDIEVWVRRLASELLAEPEVAPALHRRLVALSEWLLLAGDELWSRVALVTAGAMLEEKPQQVPFVRALVQRDLELALKSLRQPSEPGSDSESV